MIYETPPLSRRLLPLLVVGYAVGAIRLALDFWDREAAMWFGLYYVMPIAILWVGLTRKWGLVGWWTMTKTMLAVGFLVFGVWTAIAYTVGQFMEWTDGRYYPGVPEVDAEGVVHWVDGPERDARAPYVRESAAGKFGVGLLHGLISSLVGTAWCTLFGSLFVWVYRRPQR